eukprot:3545013-Alexandrium_andersonii.AAC.1
MRAAQSSLVGLTSSGNALSPRAPSPADQDGGSWHGQRGHGTGLPRLPREAPRQWATRAPS